MGGNGDGGRWLIAMATAVTLACLPTAAETAFYTGNDLWDRCSGTSAFQSGLCAGFVAGVADVASSINTKECFPPRVTVGQTVDVVKRFLEQHPEMRHEAAVGLVAQALAEAFPCKQ